MKFNIFFYIHIFFSKRFKKIYIKKKKYIQNIVPINKSYIHSYNIEFDILNVIYLFFSTYIKKKNKKK